MGARAKKEKYRGVQEGTCKEITIWKMGLKREAI
jgi:hypothetical protein